MKLPSLTINDRGRMNKHQRQMYFQYIENIFATLKTEDQVKMDYVKNFIKKLPLPGILEGDEITLGTKDIRMLQYFIYCAILNHELASGSEKFK